VVLVFGCERGEKREEREMSDDGVFLPEMPSEILRIDGGCTGHGAPLVPSDMFGLPILLVFGMETLNLPHIFFTTPFFNTLVSIIIYFLKI